MYSKSPHQNVFLSAKIMKNRAFKTCIEFLKKPNGHVREFLYVLIAALLAPLRDELITALKSFQFPLLWLLPSGII